MNLLSKLEVKLFKVNCIQMLNCLPCDSKAAIALILLSEKCSHLILDLVDSLPYNNNKNNERIKNKIVLLLLLQI